MPPATRKEMKELVRKDKLLKRAFELIESDREFNALIDQVNKALVDRRGYNDHGIVHARTVARNALKMLEILSSRGLKPNTVLEGVGDYSDAKLVVFLASYLHDLGNCVSRKDHEIFSVVLAKDVLSRILPELYPNAGKRAKIIAYVLEAILSHMGNYAASTLEASVVAVADGTDIEAGRGRIPFTSGKVSIHNASAMSIQKVTIEEGQEKPVEIIVEMRDFSGLFQVEEILCRKIEATPIRRYVMIRPIVAGEEVRTYTFD